MKPMTRETISVLLANGGGVWVREVTSVIPLVRARTKRVLQLTAPIAHP